MQSGVVFQTASKDVPLEAGDLLVIEPETLHSFHICRRASGNDTFFFTRTHARDLRPGDGACGFGLGKASPPMSALFGFTGPPCCHRLVAMGEAICHRGCTACRLVETPQLSIGFSHDDACDGLGMASGDLWQDGEKLCDLAGFVTRLSEAPGGRLPRLFMRDDQPFLNRPRSCCHGAEWIAPRDSTWMPPPSPVITGRTWSSHPLGSIHGQDSFPGGNRNAPRPFGGHRGTSWGSVPSGGERPNRRPPLRVSRQPSVFHRQHDDQIRQEM